MKSRVSLITPGVDHLQRAVRFYRDGLGLRTAGIVGTEFESGAVAFFVGPASSTDICLAMLPPEEPD